MESSLLTFLGAAILAYGPAYMANMAPPPAKWLGLPGARPIWPARLGTHKTYRGLAVGILAGATTATLFWWLGTSWCAQSFFVSVGTGALVGLAAMVGDMLKSAIKRAVGVPAGQPFVPWDQIDFILGASLVMLPLGVVSWKTAGVALIITPLLHVLVNIAAYLAGLKDVWW